eukprot:6059414-Pyramimonas_sp.AAC.1
MLPQEALRRPFFTNDRLRALGSESDGPCPLCGQQDSLHHRLWCCQAQECVEAREAAASLEIIAEGAQTGRADFTANGEPLVDYSILSSASDVVVDGSCTRGPIRELSRAAYAGGFLTEGSAEVTARFEGPVSASLPQTPQAAEQMAIIAPAFAVRVHVQTQSDCLGVISVHNQSSAQVLAGRSKRADLRR